MKLDLLYEVDVPKPWTKPHPYGQREAEQKSYREAVEQILRWNEYWPPLHPGVRAQCRGLVQNE